MPLLTATLGRVQVRLGAADVWKRSVGREQPPARDEQLLGRELGDDLAAGGRDDQLLLDAGGADPVGRWPVGLEGEEHALLELLGMIDRDQAREDRLLP